LLQPPVDDPRERDVHRARIRSAAPTHQQAIATLQLVNWIDQEAVRSMKSATAEAQTDRDVGPDGTSPVSAMALRWLAKRPWAHPDRRLPWRHDQPSRAAPGRRARIVVTGHPIARQLLAESTPEPVLEPAHDLRSRSKIQ
jgi:hypothetical protein